MASSLAYFFSGPLVSEAGSSSTEGSFLPLGFGAIDLREYWTASVLFLRGENPYDVAKFTELQRSVAADGESTIYMFNPPIVFVVIGWFGLLSYSTLAVMWLAISATLAASSMAVVRSWWSAKPLLPCLIVATFYPLHLALSYGQISTVLAFGFAVYLARRESTRVEGKMIAGAALALTLIKPHLLYLVYLALVIRLLTRRETAVLAGMCVAATLGMLAVGAANPLAITGFFGRAAEAPYHFMTPTFGSLLQDLLLHGVDDRYAPLTRWAPTVGALLITPWFLPRGRELTAAEVLALTGASLFTSPYGWVYDFVVLLPLVSLHERLPRFVPYAVLLLNILLMIEVGLAGPEIGQQAFFWFPASVFALGVVATLTEQRQGAFRTSLIRPGDPPEKSE